MCPAGVNRSSIQPFGFNVSSTVSFWIKVLISIVAVEVLGGMGAAVTSSQIPEWYAGLNKPV
ncbi:MAG: hypothetical protein ACI9DF_006153, partial [Verrucomicrobiales bacterium]